MRRSYPRLSIEDFGRHLLSTGDLDPVYIGVTRTSWDDAAHRDRWLVAYWCLYHCGAASAISEHSGAEFWQMLGHAAENVLSPSSLLGLPSELQRWPRGHERRHWRGRQALASLQDLRGRYGDRPEGMVEAIAEAANKDSRFKNVSDFVQIHKGFGPWMSFKIGDMLDRLEIQRVDFTNADVFMFTDPVKAAELLYREREQLLPSVTVRTEAIIPGVVAYLVGEFKDFLAPPSMDRPVGLQEVETVLCKWKSHKNGHYPLFNDIDEIQSGLAAWSGIETARALAHAMPRREGNEQHPQ